MLSTPKSDLRMSLTEHKRMIWHLCKNKYLLEDALKISKNSLWIRGIELPVNDDFVDLVIQDKDDPYTRLPNITTYIIELKSEKANHESLGQLKKYVNFFNTQKYRFDYVKGVSIAKHYTESGLKLLLDEGYIVLVWGEKRLRKISKFDDINHMSGNILVKEIDYVRQM